jgi:hypothetical protein
MQELNPNSRSPSGNGARLELRHWAKARAYRNCAHEYLQLARGTSEPNVRNRYVKIAQHYGTLAKAEERSARRKAADRQASAHPART